MIYMGIFKNLMSGLEDKWKCEAKVRTLSSEEIGRAHV